jgi:hypothetical protein
MEAGVPFQSSVSVEVRPGTALARWKIVHADACTRHSVRSDSLAFAGKVSSAVDEFDTAAMHGVVRVGGIYKLQSGLGDSERANQILDSGCVVHGVRVFEGLTPNVVITPLMLLRLNASTPSR